MELKIKTAIKIQKPAHEVFEAIVDPARMSNYFISKSSGRMEDGRQVIWRFPEFDMEFPIQVRKTEKDRYVSYTWTDPEQHETLVEINLKDMNGKETLVEVTEGTREGDEEGIKWLQGNTQGWANFLACLKAYLEYNINLRKGAF